MVTLTSHFLYVKICVTIEHYIKLTHHTLLHPYQEVHNFNFLLSSGPKHHILKSWEDIITEHLATVPLTALHNMSRCSNRSFWFASSWRILSHPTKFGVLKKALVPELRFIYHISYHGMCARFNDKSKRIYLKYTIYRRQNLHLYKAAQFPLCCDVSCGPQAATDSRKSSGSNGFNCGGI